MGGANHLFVRAARGSTISPVSSERTHVTPTSPTARALCSRVLAVIAAVVLGLVLHRVLRGHLAALEHVAAVDPFGARRQLAGEVRIGGLALFGLTAALGSWFVVLSLRARHAGQFPPPNASLWTAARRTFTGAASRRMAAVGIALGAVLVGASVVGAAIVWKMAQALVACQAR